MSISPHVLTPHGAVAFAIGFMSAADNLNELEPVFRCLDRVIQILNSLPNDATGNPMCPGDQLAHYAMASGEETPAIHVEAVKKDCFFEEAGGWPLISERFMVITKTPTIPRKAEGAK